MRTTKIKAIVSGDIIEIFKYQKPMLYEFTAPQSGKGHTELSEEEEKLRKIDSRTRSMRRAKTWVTRLIYSNAWRWKQDSGDPFPPAFITFTFAENLTEISEANSIFTKFIKRLNFNLNKDKASVLQYVAITEFQKRGAVHFHCLFFNLPVEHIRTERATRRIATIWGHGFIDIEEIDEIGKATRYLTKYMIKNFEDMRLDGKKRYFGSRKLRKPVVVRLEHLAEKILSAIPPERKVYENTYESEHQGITTYMKFQLNRGELLRLKKSEISGTIAPS